MGVYIKGMEMPTRCGRCDFRIPAFDDGLFDHYECCITAAIIDNLGEKMEDCPLAPVPPHGRLIDADEAYEAALIQVQLSYASRNKEQAAMAVANVISNSPTIIPASGGAEDE